MPENSRRLRLTVQGTVQGVGFRPFVYRLAAGLGLTGWIRNSAQGVVIEVEGDEDRLSEFRRSLETEPPAHCVIYSIEASVLDSVGYEVFEIRRSGGGDRRAVILPDLATCGACRTELFDPSDRRYRYPFINCTHCGPRFSIIEALPYDRPNTSMKAFQMCPSCQREYKDPNNRRFHAQPNACPACGPQIALWDSRGAVVASRDEAIGLACERLRAGEVVATKGIGGFHLLVDARDNDAVLRLRRLKDREEKPFALMFPSLEQIQAECRVSEPEERLLLSPAAPIVLLPRIRGEHGAVCQAVAPGNLYLGAMLPYAPLYLLLMAELGFPVVATSGNLKDEPICIDRREAVSRLGNLVDAFLVHDRPIVRPVDDSVTRLIGGREAVIRRARGYAPLPLIGSEDSVATLAVGGHLKSSVALTVGPQVMVSQHLGDLETAEAFDGFEKAIAALEGMYEVAPKLVACDLHPGYESSLYARRLGLPVVEVQHHYAHVLACMAENELTGPVLGISWDGTGYGPDGTVWGGEFLDVDDSSFVRVAHLRTFPLPGGEQAVREPRRSALGALFELFGAEAFQMRDLKCIQAFSEPELRLLEVGLARGINSPRTSSAGRLFDAASSLCNIRQKNNFEGQAAMELEFACQDSDGEESYPVELDEANSAGGDAGTAPALVNWGGIIRSLIADVRAGVEISRVAARFHNALAETAVTVARRVGRERVVLSGGCFQNRYLTERLILRLRREGFCPYWHQRIPPNDGGISVGQVMAAIRTKGRK